MDLARLALSAALASGCYSFTTLGRARTVGRGHLQLVAAPELRGSVGVAGDPAIRPALELGGRYGITAALDGELRVSSSGAGTALRIQLASASRLHVLAAPGLAYTFADKLAFELPVVLGIDVRDDDEFVIAPRAVYQLRTGLPRPLQFVFAGASLGYVWQVAPHVALVPEVALLDDLYAEPGYGTFTEAGPAFEAAFAILWER